MSSRIRVVAIVCIALFAFTVVAAAPTLALLDAETPVADLFGILVPAPPPAVEDLALPAAPVVDVRAPRPPPLA